MYFDPTRAIYSVRSSKGVFSADRTRSEACADVQTLFDQGDQRGRVFVVGDYGDEYVCSNCGQSNTGRYSLCVCHREYPETWEST